MKKLTLFLVALYIAIAFFPIQSLAAPKVIKVGVAVTREDAAYKAWLETKAWVEKHSNGKYTLKIYDSNTLGSAAATFQGVQMGTVHIAHEGSPNYTAFVPMLSIFDLPYLFPDYASADRILEGPIGKKMQEEFSKKGRVTCVGFIANTFRAVFSNTPILTLEDAKGKKIRSTPSKVHIAGLKLFGFTPTPMPWSETVTGAQQKVISGFDCDLTFMLGVRVSEIVPYVTMTGHMYSPHPLIVCTSWLEGLSEADRSMFMDAFRFFLERSKVLIRANGEQARDILTSFGYQFQPFPDTERARWIKAAHAGYAQIEGVPQDLVKEIITQLENNPK